MGCNIHMMPEHSSLHGNVAAIVTTIGYCKFTDGKMGIYILQGAINYVFVFACLVIYLSCIVLLVSPQYTSCERYLSQKVFCSGSSDQCRWTGATKALDSHSTVFDQFRDGKMGI